MHYIFKSPFDKGLLACIVSYTYEGGMLYQL